MSLKTEEKYPFQQSKESLNLYHPSFYFYRRDVALHSLVLKEEKGQEESCCESSFFVCWPSYCLKEFRKSKKIAAHNFLH